MGSDASGFVLILSCLQLTALPVPAAVQGRSCELLYSPVCITLLTFQAVLSFPDTFLLTPRFFFSLTSSLQTQCLLCCSGLSQTLTLSWFHLSLSLRSIYYLTSGLSLLYHFRFIFVSFLANRHL